MIECKNNKRVFEHYLIMVLSYYIMYERRFKQCFRFIFHYFLLSKLRLLMWLYFRRLIFAFAFRNKKRKIVTFHIFLCFRIGFTAFVTCLCKVLSRMERQIDPFWGKINRILLLTNSNMQRRNILNPYFIQYDFVPFRLN